MKKWKCYRKTDQHKIESVFDEKGLNVCDINYYLNEDSEVNARLISCAPDMLEMLEIVLTAKFSCEEIKQLIIKATTI
jgi:hypothetical protein